MNRKPFTEYYNNPEYKSKHNAFMNTKIECPICKHMVARGNMTYHRKFSKLHKDDILTMTINMRSLTDEQQRLLSTIMQPAN